MCGVPLLRHRPRPLRHLQGAVAPAARCACGWVGVLLPVVGPPARRSRAGKEVSSASLEVEVKPETVPVPTFAARMVTKVPPQGTATIIEVRPMGSSQAEADVDDARHPFDRRTLLHYVATYARDGRTVSVPFTYDNRTGFVAQLEKL